MGNQKSGARRRASSHSSSVSRRSRKSSPAGSSSVSGAADLVEELNPISPSLANVLVEELRQVPSLEMGEDVQDHAESKRRRRDPSSFEDEYGFQKPMKVPKRDYYLAIHHLKDRVRSWEGILDYVQENPLQRLDYRLYPRSTAILFEDVDNFTKSVALIGDIKEGRFTGPRVHQVQVLTYDQVKHVIDPMKQKKKRLAFETDPSRHSLPLMLSELPLEEPQLPLGGDCSDSMVDDAAELSDGGRFEKVSCGLRRVVEYEKKPSGRITPRKQAFSMNKDPESFAIRTSRKTFSYLMPCSSFKLDSCHFSLKLKISTWEPFEVEDVRQDEVREASEQFTQEEEKEEEGDSGSAREHDFQAPHRSRHEIDFARATLEKKNLSQPSPSPVGAAAATQISEGEAEEKLGRSSVGSSSSASTSAAERGEAVRTVRTNYGSGQARQVRQVRQARPSLNRRPRYQKRLSTCTAFDQSRASVTELSGAFSTSTRSGEVTLKPALLRESS